MPTSHPPSIARDAKVYFILPAHNEEKNIARVLTDYSGFFTHPETRFQVVINNSWDATCHEARRIAQTDQRIIISNIPEAIGKGGAILSGFRAFASSLPYVGFIDGDGSIVPDETAKSIAALAQDHRLGAAKS